MEVILMICLNNRQREFREALERAGKSIFEILPDFERDSFLVINRSNEREYKVILKSVRGKVLAFCQQTSGEDCKDFKFRGRICKHIASVLRDHLCSILALFSAQNSIENLRR